MNIYDQYKLQKTVMKNQESCSVTQMWFRTPSVSWSSQKKRLQAGDTVTAYREYKQVLQNIVDAEEMIKESGGDAGLGRNGQARAQRCQG